MSRPWRRVGRRRRIVLIPRRVVERDDSPQDVGALLGPCEVVRVRRVTTSFRCSRKCVSIAGSVSTRGWLSHDCEECDAEARLHRRELVELLSTTAARHRASIDDDPYAVAVGFVAKVRDPLDVLVPARARRCGSTNRALFT